MRLELTKTSIKLESIIFYIATYIQKHIRKRANKKYLVKLVRPRIRFIQLFQNTTMQLVEIYGRAIINHSENKIKRKKIVHIYVLSHYVCGHYK